MTGAVAGFSYNFGGKPRGSSDGQLLGFADRNLGRRSGDRQPSARRTSIPSTRSPTAGPRVAARSRAPARPAMSTRPAWRREATRLPERRRMRRKRRTTLPRCERLVYGEAAASSGCQLFSQSRLGTGCGRHPRSTVNASSPDNFPLTYAWSSIGRSPQRLRDERDAWTPPALRKAARSRRPRPSPIRAA